MSARQCYKIKYASSQEAHRALKQIRSDKRKRTRSSKTIFEKRYYRCDICDCYHLTKLDKK